MPIAKITLRTSLLSWIFIAEGIRFLQEEDVMMHATGTVNPQEHPVLKYAFQFLKRG
jgi:hypothetical protein